MSDDTMTPDTNDTPARNTKERGRCWGPNTWNNYTDENREMLKAFMTAQCEDYAINEEIGESGTPHLQFALKFKNARTFISLKKIFPECHFEKARNWCAAKQYCSKSATSIGEAFVKPKIVVKDPLEGRVLREWQSNILQILDQDPDDRTINWIYDPLGNAGKTSLAKHLCIKYPKEVIYLGGKASDMKYGVMNFIDAGNTLRVVILDLTRSLENFVSYEGIESIKNGIFYNSKYECKMVLYDSPHVIVFANFEPDYDKMSEDRWNVIDI